MTWIRALAAAVLSLFLPGAGHALIRDWARALLFASVFALTVVLVLPFEDLLETGSVTEAMDVISSEPALSQFMLSFMLLFAALDAGFRAMSPPFGPTAAGDGPTCPHCGRELDTDLEFCHWCTTRVMYPDEEQES
ncbi:zinc ribbon domain-containing protein [Natronobiforma cellulositropha]|uniref:zinc ribbon domain-containing protein n=1 Tax=Natronobiforma cellulositropha TaxID=1679076 RepID=UPI0021D58297|nr:zinc ribbon domain-containing protein [Natronobiforma cellulositropha]